MCPHIPTFLSLNVHPPTPTHAAKYFIFTHTFGCRAQLAPNRPADPLAQQPIHIRTSTLRRLVSLTNAPLYLPTPRLPSRPTCSPPQHTSLSNRRLLNSLLCSRPYQLSLQSISLHFSLGPANDPTGTALSYTRTGPGRSGE